MHSSLSSNHRVLEVEISTSKMLEQHLAGYFRSRAGRRCSHGFQRRFERGFVHGEVRNGREKIGVNKSMERACSGVKNHMSPKSRPSR